MIRLGRTPRKCLGVYQYWMHPVFGFMSARGKTWFPFPISIVVNGREWPAQQLEQAGLSYRRRRNCFTWIEDVERAQALMQEQLRANRIALLEGVRAAVHPLFSEICRQYPMTYHWVCQDSEWAMGPMFRDGEQLHRLYPQLAHLGMTGFSSPDVLRFMGKRARPDGKTVGVHELPISSNLRVRPNGVRIKHRLGPSRQSRGIRHSWIAQPAFTASVVPGCGPDQSSAAPPICRDQSQAQDVAAHGLAHRVTVRQILAAAREEILRRVRRS